MRTIRTEKDLEKAVANQVAALKASSAAYDQGHEWEAARLATVVHTLVHDAGKNNRSLLTQLGKRDVLQFTASGHAVSPTNMLASTPLVFTRLSSEGAKYLPHLGEGPEPLRQISCREWWERDPIYRQGLSDKNPLTRRRLVFNLRNKDGGSHYDPFLDDDAYIAATQKPVWYSVINNVETPLLGLELASMRQVAWELLDTLKKGGLIND